MGILKDIWNTIFGKSKKQEEFGRGGSIEQPTMKVVYKKEKSSSELFCKPNFDSSNYDAPEVHKSVLVVEPSVISDIEPKTVPADGLINENNVTIPTKKKNALVGLKTKIKIGEYFQQFSSLDELTCKQKFKVKSLRNIVSELRKDGFKFETENIELHNELGEKKNVLNYKLIK
jgi:hypothetical protein